MELKRSQVNAVLIDPSANDEPDEAPFEFRLAERGRLRAQALLLTLLVFAVYAAALGGSFIYLDDQTITANPLLRSFPGLLNIWVHPTLSPQYQPLAYTAYFLQYKLFGSTVAAGYLAINILLHAANVLLLWTLLCKINLRGALAAAILFAVFPTNVTTVAWISCQPMLLSGIFALASIIVSLDEDGRHSLLRRVISDILFLAAAMCHPWTVVLPAIILILLRWHRGKLTRDDFKTIRVMVCLSIFWTIVQIYCDDRRTVGFIRLVDHWAYFPAAAGVAALIAVSSRGWSKIAARCTVGLLTIALAVVTIWRIGDYKTSRALWQSKLRRDPNSLIAHNQLGLLDLRDSNNYMSATNHFKIALEQDPKNITTLLNLAAAHRAGGDPAKAIMRYHEALYISPDNIDAHLGLAIALAEQGSSSAAAMEYEKVLRIQPAHVVARNNLGLLRAQRGEFEEAIRLYKSAIQDDPSFTATYVNYANLLFQKGEVPEAARLLEQAIEFDPKNFGIYMSAGAMVSNLAATVVQTQEREALLTQAEMLLRQAVALRPMLSETHSHLGLILMQQNEFDEALFHLERAATLSPGDADVQRSIELAKHAADANRTQK